MEPQHIVSIDEIELHSRKIVKIEESSSHNRPATTREEKIKTLMRAQIKAVEEARIQKVIFLLRDHDNFVKYFEPRVASFGPIHHGKPKYQRGEKYKLMLAHEFVQGCSGNNETNLYENINCLYEHVKKEIKGLKECFEEECFEEKVVKEYDDESLAWMLFVDGCAILQYILCATSPAANDKFKPPALAANDNFKPLAPAPTAVANDKFKPPAPAPAANDKFKPPAPAPAANDKFKELNIKNDSVAFIQQDLFLLENQVPYRLLKLLMRLSGKEVQLSKLIESFIQNINYLQREQQTPEEERDPTHLLDLLRTRLLGPPSPRWPYKKTRICIEKPAHLLDRLRTRLFCNPENKSNNKNMSGGQSYRNVQELRAAGIQLKPSESSSLADVAFTDQFTFYPGYIYLPPITVDDSTGPKFLNLIAYEMCPDFDYDFGVYSYISFLDSLIDHPDDVKELRKAQVLNNLLGSDKEVSQLFNDIATDLVPNPKTYDDVKKQIQKCYNSKWKTWIAQAIHDHFSSPWTFVGFTAGLLIFFLTATQTWYTVFSPAP